MTKWNDRFAGTEPHRVDHLVYRPIARGIDTIGHATEFVVDITDTMDQKIAAIACYKSQFPEARFERLSHYVKSIAGYEGGACGFTYGELFAVPRPIAVSDMVQLFGKWPIPAPFDPPRF